jgi:hypothetical protein
MPTELPRLPFIVTMVKEKAGSEGGRTVCRAIKNSLAKRRFYNITTPVNKVQTVTMYIVCDRTKKNTHTQLLWEADGCNSYYIFYISTSCPTPNKLAAIYKVYDLIFYYSEHI